MIRMVLLILACLLFIAAGVGVSYKNLNFGWLGLAALTVGLWLPVATP